MLAPYHIEIMHAALGSRFSPRAMTVMIQANLRQDRISGQIGHDEFHFDNNAFDESYAYVESQRALVTSSLKNRDARSAWMAFGRLTHTLQDFYAHSNYVTLWLDRFNGQTPLPPPEIDPIDPSLIHSPRLHTGKVYLPFDALYVFRPARAFALRFLPKDSHGWMNLDSPEQGFKFDYALHAAIKRTVIEFERTTEGFSDEMCRLFLDE